MWTGQMHMTEGRNSDQKSPDEIVSTWAIFTSQCELGQGCAFSVSVSQAITFAQQLTDSKKSWQKECWALEVFVQHGEEQVMLMEGEMEKHRQH